LREVQFALNRDVESLEFRIKALNIWAMPLALTLVAVMLAFVRRRRAEQFRQVGEGR
jgi:cytochrome c-type biogenesis protein CcmH/NrfF